MIEQYGKEVFSMAFDLIKKNQEMIFTEDYGEEKVFAQISNLFETDMTARGFMGRCTTFLIM